MTVGWLVEGRGDHLCVYRAGHIRDFLRTLIDEQHHDVSLGVVGSNGIGNVFHQDSLTCLRLSHNQCTLTLTNRREQIDDTDARICGSPVAAKGELLLREEWREVLEGHAVTYLRRYSAIDGLHC